MKTVSPDVPQPRILLFGIRCRFTEIVSATFVHRGHPPIAAILPGPERIDHPVRVSPVGGLVPMVNARERSAAGEIPQYLVGRLASREAHKLVADLRPDIVVVACFPRRIPRAIYHHLRLGGINIHPSLLPSHRGPDPLFWIMRDEDDGCGVTVHRLSERLDSGDILAQQPVPYPHGVREDELEGDLACAGADLALSVVADLNRGLQRSLPQDERRASYETWPFESDYAIDSQQPARSAWNFVRGVAKRGVPIRVVTNDGVIIVADALRFSESGEPPAPEDGQVAIRFNPGWLLATLAR